MVGTMALVYGTGAYYIKLFSKHSWSEIGHSNGEFIGISRLDGMLYVFL